jgi:ribose 1,5-bisphosphokinase
MNGQLLYTVGPSGAGKDSVLAWLKAHGARAAQSREANTLQLARRTITRPVQPDGEQHERMDLPGFERCLAAGGFAMHWRANELCYGVRHEALKALPHVAWLLVNGSRAHLPTALQQFPHLCVLHITASEATLRARLQARGRETPEAIEARIRRSPPLILPASVRVIKICNDGTLDEAGERLLKQLQMV